MDITLELVESAWGSDGTALQERDLQLPLLARSVRRQLLGNTLKVGDRQVVVVFGRQREFEVVRVSGESERGHIIVEEGTDMRLFANGCAAQSSPDAASPHLNWHSEASTGVPLAPALAKACETTWSKEIDELCEVMRMVMAVREVDQLPLGISRGVLLQAAPGGGKTMLLRYFMHAARSSSTDRMCATAVVTAQALQADRLARLARQQAPGICESVPPFSVLAFSGMDVHTSSAAASGQHNGFASFLAHADSLSKLHCQPHVERPPSAHDPSVLLVWFDDLDMLLATDPSGDDNDENVPANASSTRRQLLAWLSQLPHRSNIVVVGSVNDAAITAKAIPGLVSTGRLSRSLVLPPPSRRARQHIISVTLRGLLAPVPHDSSSTSVTTNPGSAPEQSAAAMYRTLAAVDDLATWGAGRTGGYLPGDLVRWCRRAHLRASVHTSNSGSLRNSDASKSQDSISASNARLGIPEIEGKFDLDTAELQRCLSTTLVEVVPASLVHPWEVAPSSRSSVSGADGVWTALAGYEDVKTELRRLLAWPEQHHAAWLIAGVKWNRTALALPRPKGVLLHGPSGCGKTVLARGLATAFPALNVLEVRGTALFSPLVGEAEAALRDVAKRVRLCIQYIAAWRCDQTRRDRNTSLRVVARAAAPCLLILDELDSIAPARSGSDSNEDEVGRRLLGTLLNEMDGVGHAYNRGSSSTQSEPRSQDGVIFVGCTNRREAIDPAVLRPGRMDKHVEVPLPDVTNRLEILSFATDAMALASDVNLGSLAAHPRLLGASGATLVGICRDAAFAALREASASKNAELAGSKAGAEVSVAARHFAAVFNKL